MAKFYKGQKPWNKDLKGIHLSPESEFKKGDRPSPKTEFKKGELSREKHPFWKGGRRRTVNGYIMLNVIDHPRAYRNEVYEHIIVAENKIGRYLLKGECVHHINGIRDDNRPENLIVCGSSSEHMSLHKGELNKRRIKIDVELMLRMYLKDGLYMKEIARRLGVNQCLIQSRIKEWKSSQNQSEL